MRFSFTFIFIILTNLGLMLTPVADASTSTAFKRLSDPVAGAESEPVEDGVVMIGDPDGTFNGLVVEASSLTQQEDDLSTDAFEALQDGFKNDYDFGIQHRGDMIKKTIRPGLRLYETRTVLKDEQATLVMNEDYIFLPNGTAYAFFFISRLANEHKSLKARDALRVRLFQKSSPSTSAFFRFIESSGLVASAQAKNREVGRSRGGSSRPANSQSVRQGSSGPARECLNVGIKNPSDIRKASDRISGLTKMDIVDACGAGVGNVLKSAAMSMAPGSDIRWTKWFGLKSAQSDEAFIATVPFSAVMNMGDRTLQALSSAKQKFAQWWSANNGNVTKALQVQWQKKKSNWNCLSRAAQTRLVCQTATIMATMVTPGGVMSAGAKLRIAKSVDQVVDVAEETFTVTARVGQETARGSGRATVPPAAKRVAANDNGATGAAAPKGSTGPKRPAKAANDNELGFAKHDKVPCVARVLPSIWNLFAVTAYASPCASAAGYDKLWKKGEKLEESAVDAISEAKESIKNGGSFTDAMAQLRQARATAREAGEAFAEAAELGKSARTYEFAADNFIVAGESSAAASVRLKSVARLDENPATIASGLQKQILYLQAQLAKGDDVFFADKLRTLKDTLKKFNEGVPSAIAQRQRLRATVDGPSGTTTGAPNGVPSSTASAAPTSALPEMPPVKQTLPPPKPVVRSEPTLSDRVKIARDAGDGETASRLFQQTIVKPDFDDNGFSRAFTESVNAEGTVARELASKVNKGDVEQLTNFVDRFEAQIPSNMTETQRVNLLSAAHEIRKTGGEQALGSGRQGTLARVEQRLMKPAENPAQLSGLGRISEARTIYRQRLANGWTEAAVAREIESRLLRHQMMLRTANRPGMPRNSGDVWTDLIRNDTEVFRRVFNREPRTLPRAGAFRSVRLAISTGLVSALKDE